METIYNIYLYFDPDDRCDRVGYAAHDLDGDDDLGKHILQKNVKADLQRAIKVKLTKRFTRQEFNTYCRLGNERELYGEALLKAGAVHAPLVLVSPVVKGKVTYNYSSQVGDFDIGDAAAAAGEHGQMVDWFKTYFTDSGFRFTDLIHDDYFVAIRLTYQNGLFVSSMKLLLSCIDSLAYVEYGDLREPPSFVRWLNAYADLQPLGIIPEELWELRNGLLHMTNLNSTNVRKNSIRRISFRVGQSGTVLPDTGSIYFFEFRSLIDAVAQAIGRWGNSYSVDREKIHKFVERYDETVSDGRLAIVQVSH
ncbi:hypothetical protein VDF71_05520 [Xanthomonas campestris pv. raphani]|uniref:hypothetical protein n=1 Tax=Xanthomonas campestris TaxID=339 RepID=UPI002B229A3E|nr:hypothetical protein [Xanthomonas campestris]MEA9770774.1 hypothetical protein [Xanthomonas campestris pv. raphani]MEA9799327.1 hypothetical protein [Xanthomonas campestris pv. raphani]